MVNLDFDGCDKLGVTRSFRGFPVRYVMPKTLLSPNCIAATLRIHKSALQQTCITPCPIGYSPTINYQSLERRRCTWLVYLVGGFTCKADRHDARGTMSGADQSIGQVGEWGYLWTRTDTHELQERKCGEVILYSLYKLPVSHS